MKRTLTFEKEENGDWYVVLPEWTGNRSDLQMVLGADELLNILSQNKNNVDVSFSDELIEDANLLTLQYETEDIGGGLYLLKNYSDIELNLNVWLCEVTRFVFDKMPEKIYFK